MGFIIDVVSIIKQLPKNRVTILLSATMDIKLDEIINNHMYKPKMVMIEDKKSEKQNIEQIFYEVLDKDKEMLLQDVTTLQNPDSCIIFCNTQTMVDYVDDYLYVNGYVCDKLHGGMDQKDRTLVMNRFKRNEFRYLVATDVAARGIDVDNISLVVNYDMPFKIENFVHRTGRTGRNNKSGIAISFVNDNDKVSLKQLNEQLNTNYNVMIKPDKKQVEKVQDQFDLKIKTIPEIKLDKGNELSKDILKIHINAGKKTKMRAVDIVGTFCSIEGMSASDIGIINILDISTFVEILNGKGEMVLEVLQTKNIKGRPRIVSRVD